MTQDSKTLSFTIALGKSLTGIQGPWKQYIDVPFTPERVRICSIAINTAATENTCLGLCASFCGSSNTVHGGIVAVFNDDAGTVYPNATYKCNNMQTSAEFTVVDMLTGAPWVPAETVASIAFLLEFTASEASVTFPAIPHLSNPAQWPGNVVAPAAASQAALNSAIETVAETQPAELIV